MTIASVNALVLSLLEEKSLLETERMFIDQRREVLARYTSDLCTEYQAKLAKSIEAKDEDPEDSVEVYNDEDFQLQYAAAQKRLENQDKALQVERSRLETKLNQVTTQIEGAEKRLQTNIEKEMKGISS